MLYILTQDIEEQIARKCHERKNSDKFVHHNPAKYLRARCFCSLDILGYEGTPRIVVENNL